MSRDWTDNRAGKTSDGIFQVLRKHGYLRVDPGTGTVLIRAVSLQKERSLQTVSRWCMEMYPKAWPVLMGELRNILRLNIGKDLEDHSDSAEDASQASIYKKFLRHR